MANQQVIVSVLADTRRFNTAMAGTDKALKNFQTGLTRINRIGVVTFASLTVAIGHFVAKSIKAAEEAEAVDRKLINQAKNIKTLGKDYATTATRLIDYSESVQKLIGVDDDIVKSAQTLLLTFPELAKTAKVAGGAFDRTTLAAFNLAEMGIGTAEKNAIQLGKALEDPIKGLGSLRKSGVTFSNTQRDQIKNWVETGKKAKAYSYILDIIETQSKNAGVEGVTATQKLTTSWDNFTETFGKKLLPKLTPVIDELTTALDDLAKSPDFEEFVKAFADAIKTLAKQLPGIVRNLGKLLKVMNDNNISVIDVAIGWGLLTGALKFLSSNVFGSFLTKSLAIAKRNKAWVGELKTLKTGMKEADDAIKTHQTAMEKLYKKGGKLTDDDAKKFWEHKDAVDKNTKALEDYKTKYENVTKKVGDAGKVFDNSTGKIKNTSTAFSKFADFFKKMPSWAKGGMKLLGRIGIVLTIIEGAFYAVTGFIEGFKKGWDDWVKANPETVKELNENLGPALEDLKWTMEGINAIFDAFWGLVKDIFKWLGTVFAVTLGGILTTINAIVGGLKYIGDFVFPKNLMKTPQPKIPLNTFIGPAPSSTPKVNLGNNMYAGPSSVNVTVNSLVPTAETGRLVAKSFNEYMRTGGSRAV